MTSTTTAPDAIFHFFIAADACASNRQS